MIKFRVDRRKVIEALVYVAERTGEVTPFFASKILYFADVDHLRKFGRPITGETYIAMENGPVPSFAYDVLKGKPLAEATDIFENSLELKRRKHPTVAARRKPDLRYLSRTDLECIEHSIEHCMARSFGQLSDETHAHTAWKNAPLNGPMTFEDILDGVDRAIVEDAEISAAYAAL